MILSIQNVLGTIWVVLFFVFFLVGGILTIFQIFSDTSNIDKELERTSKDKTKNKANKEGSSSN